MSLRHFIAIGLFLLASVATLAAPEDALVEMLHIDRFHQYTQRWAQTMETRNQKVAAEVIKGLSAEDLARFKFTTKELSDAFNYDDLILRVLEAKKPKAGWLKRDLAWEYNFYKRKLNEAYTVEDVKELYALTPEELEQKRLSIRARNKALVMLDVDSYVSDRTTRGVFWEASQHQRRVELHVGTAGSFREHITATGAKVLGEVTTTARNYNPILLVQYPGEKDFVYAITEIAGNDRVQHLAAQSSMVRWEGTKGKLAPPPPVSVVGDAAAKLLAEEQHLTQVLKVAPRADKVIIGQKGAWEKTFQQLAKAEAMQEFLRVNSKVRNTLLEDSARAIATRLLSSNDLISYSLAYGPELDKLAELLGPRMEKAGTPLPQVRAAFDYDRGSYEVSDYILKGKDGKEQRWRIFSNMWGDEVVPVANALKATGVKDVVYIGTAGALPGSGMKVGDVAIPRTAIDQEGVSYKVKENFSRKVIATTPGASVHGMTSDVTVINVASPLDETKQWVRNASKVAQVVEVETAYLAQAFQSRGVNLTPFLLISDVVGAEGESLAAASSTARRRGQVTVLKSVLFDAEVTSSLPRNGAATLMGMIEEAFPNRHPPSVFHLHQEAIRTGASTPAEIRKLGEKIPGFTTARLESTLANADMRLWAIEELLEDAGVKARFSIKREFLTGLWAPGKSIPEVHIHSRSTKDLKEIHDLLAKLQHSDPEFRKHLNVTVGSITPGDEWLKVAHLPDEGLFNLTYRESALQLGGIAATETSSGNLKFVRVAEPDTRKVLTNLAYFPPDDDTAKLLKELQGKGDAGKVLKAEVAAMNAFAGPNKPWEVHVVTVDKLPDGRLAQIVPNVAGKADNLTIELRITKAGLANPAVVMEELIHLQQITNAPVGWKKNTQLKAFVHPYHWAEVIANAQAGSAQAIEKLARLELEAAQMADDAIKHYKKTGLFKAEAAVIDSYLEARLAHADELYREVAKTARADMRKRKEGWDRARTVFDKLEKQADKLNDLVAKGDRTGVRKMIEAYLPWSLMEPTEQKVWKEWLDAMEKPNRKKVDLVFRGMYDDTILRARDGKPYLMSTVLTRNQGSYTRRLRSLATMREKFGSQALRDSFSSYHLAGAKNPGAISVMMANHAIEAKGSPFLSTAAYDVATKFGPRQIGAFHLEERRFALNGLAPDKYLYQKERLTPLIIFPDEVVFFHDYASAPVEGVGPRDPSNRKKHFIGEVEKVLGRKVTAAEITGVGSDRDFVKESFERLKPMLLESDKLPNAGACMVGTPACDCLFQGLNSLLK